MEQSSLTEAHLERLAADHRRLSLVYGLSIISLSLVITAMVWSTPSFEIFPTQKGVTRPEDLLAAVAQFAPPPTSPSTTLATTSATTTPTVKP